MQLMPSLKGPFYIKYTALRLLCQSLTYVNIAKKADTLLYLASTSDPKFRLKTKTRRDPAVLFAICSSTYKSDLNPGKAMMSTEIQ